jgi:hypothetical protein
MSNTNEPQGPGPHIDEQGRVYYVQWPPPPKLSAAAIERIETANMDSAASAAIDRYIQADAQRVFNTPEWEEAFAKVGFYDLELQYQVMVAELQQLKAKRLAAMNEAIAYVFDARRRAAHEAQGGNGLSSPEINA